MAPKIVARDAPEITSSTQVALHPLVFVNITDHFSRRNLGIAKRDKRACGVLLGCNLGKKLEIHTTFELKFEDVASQGGVKVDHEFLKRRRDAMTKVFPDYDVVGWYTTGTGLSEHDIETTHREMLQYNESAVVMVMDANPDKGQRALPVYLFETSVTATGSGSTSAKTKIALAKVPYTVESEESERIGVETAMQVDFNVEKNQSIVPQVDRLSNAVLMLKARVAVVSLYLKKVKAGEIPPDYELLRRISTVVNQLPRADHPSFNVAFNTDYDDAVLATFIGTVAKGTTALNHFLGTAQALNERRRGGGMFM